MSRSGYSDELEPWDMIRWRGAVTAAIRGRRGQAFLREMRAALDAMPVRRLVAKDLVTPDGCCAMGAVCVARGANVSGVDPEDYDSVAEVMGVAGALAREIAWENDEVGRYETADERWTRMRQWCEQHITPTTEDAT